MTDLPTLSPFRANELVAQRGSFFQEGWTYFDNAPLGSPHVEVAAVFGTFEEVDNPDARIIYASGEFGEPVEADAEWIDLDAI